MSYNVYPGWKSNEILRDAMLLASGDSATPDEKVREARRMVDFLEEVSPADGVLSSVLAVSNAHAIGFGDSYLLHDELETFNERKSGLILYCRHRRPHHCGWRRGEAHSELTRSESDASTFNLWHETLILSPADRHLLPLLDGSRDRDALLDALLAVHRENPIPIERDGKQVSDEAEMRDALEHIDALPEHLAEMKVLRLE